MPKIRTRSSMAGAGCVIQGLGLLSLLVALATFATIVGPIVFGILGLWLLVLGSQKSQWFECSDCGTKLANKKLTICPSCNGKF